MAPSTPSQGLLERLMRVYTMLVLLYFVLLTGNGRNVWGIIQICGVFPSRTVLKPPSSTESLRPWPES